MTTRRRRRPNSRPLPIRLTIKARGDPAGFFICRHKRRAELPCRVPVSPCHEGRRTVSDVRIMHAGAARGEGSRLIGWARNNRRWLKPLAAALVLGLAAFLLYRTLSRYDFDELFASVKSIPLSRLGTALLFAAASYFCLTLFDFLALHYVGHPLRLSEGRARLVHQPLARPQYRLRRSIERRGALPLLFALGTRRRGRRQAHPVLRRHRRASA